MNLCLAFVYTEGKYRHTHKYVYTHRLYTATSAERPRRNNILLTMSTATKILVSNVILKYKELGLLRAMADSRARTNIYKMSLEHLFHSTRN